MTKTEYRQARRLIRANGRSAYAWIAQQMGGDWTVANKLRDLADAQDWMAERADIVRWCKREGVHCSAWHTAHPSAGRRLDAIRKAKRTVPA